MVINCFLNGFITLRRFNTKLTVPFRWIEYNLLDKYIGVPLFIKEKPTQVCRSGNMGMKTAGSRNRKAVRDIIFTILVLYIAWLISGLLLPNTGVENNSALIFVLAVVIISFLTDGYRCGIAASLVSTVLINWFFMYPYGKLNFSLTGYPIAMISTLTSALVVCTLTSRTKQHARMAEERERKTAELYRQNAILEKKKRP